VDSISEISSKSVRQECEEIAGELILMVIEINALNTMLPPLNKQLIAVKLTELKPIDRIAQPR
jgi:hypothetical protein